MPRAIEHFRQHLNSLLTPWHITFGTYGARLHGDNRPTVDREHNQLDTPFLSRDHYREEYERGRLRFPPRYFTTEQRSFIESELPNICHCGGWGYRICAAGPDHVHLLCDVIADVHGEKVRRLVKRWLGQELAKHWPLPSGATWWAEEGSNIAIANEEYLNNCFIYIRDQRTTPFTYANHVGAEDGPAR
jgi:REP element-mobilizing transposase RayT